MTSPFAEIISEKTLYSGFNILKEYDIKVRSLKDQSISLPPMNREVLHCTDSIAVLIYVKSADSFLLCQQFRTGVFFNAEERDPYILEIPAGMVDPGYTPEQTAIKEVEEETGVKIDSVECFSLSYASTGRITEKTWFYYAELDEAPETGIFGNEEESEDIKTHLISRTKAYEMLAKLDIVHAPTISALYWYKAEKDKMI